MNEFKENELVIAFAQGDQKAFKEVFDLYYRDLCHFASNMINDWEHGKDIASESMTKLWNKHKHFESLQNVKAFLYITTRNACLNFLQSRKRQYVLKDKMEENLQSDDYLLVNIIKIEFFKRLEKEIENLPEKQRMVFQLFFMEDLSYEAIAQKMNVTVSTVRNSKSIALSKLRNIFFTEKSVISFFFLLYVLSQY